jgi:ATP-dependent Clp protease ATP-binding subunit ClpA
VVFHSLNAGHIREIVDLQLNDLRSNLADKSMKLEVTPELLDYLGTEGFDEIFGARPLRRVIQNEVEDPLSDEMLDSTYQEGDTIRIGYVDEKIKIERVEGAVDPPEPPGSPEEPAEPVEPALTS